MVLVRFARPVRRHRIGRAHAMHVITTVIPTRIPAAEVAAARLIWIGPKGHPRHASHVEVEEEQVTEHHHVAGPDVDLDVEEVRDRQARRITTEYAERAADEALRIARPGRPALGASGQHSPRVSFRIPEQTRRQAEERARSEGRTVSEVAREALERYLQETD